MDKFSVRTDAATAKQMVENHADQVLKLIYNIAQKVLPMNHIAYEDSVQNAYIHIMEKIHTYDGSSALSTFISVLTIQHIKNIRRAETTRANRLRDTKLAKPTVMEVPDDLGKMLVDSVLTEPDETLKVMLTEFFCHNRTTRQIAPMVGVSHETVRTRINNWVIHKKLECGLDVSLS